MPPRRLAVLIDELPATSQTARRDTHGWTVGDELSAQTVEYLSAQLYAFTRAHTERKKAGRVPKPAKVPRPWSKPESKPSPASKLVSIARALKGG